MTDDERPGAPAPPDSITPVAHGSPIVSPYDKPAGGLDGVRAALAYTLEQAGLVRGVQALSSVNQADGFDCPSCAWPDPARRGRIEFCENGAKATADEATRRRVDASFFAAWSISKLLAQSDHWLGQQGRLVQPMYKGEGDSHYRPVSWEKAFALIAGELQGLVSPDEAVFYTSGRTSCEAAFLYQLFVRMLGTNNLPDCSNMCHESSGVGLMGVIGVGKGTVQLEDFEHCDAIFVIGQNPGTNHPRMLSALRAAKLRGCRIVVVNPLREAGLVRFSHPQKLGDALRAGVELADVYLQIKVGSDIAILKALMKLLVDREHSQPGSVLDREFIATHTRGFEALVADLDKYDLDALCATAGVSVGDVRQAAEVAIASRATIYTWAMGVTQHKHGVANVREIANLALLQGNVGKRGAGLCPVRGHSNVQGDRTMGIWEQVPPWIHRLEQEFDFVAPKKPGYETVGTIRAMDAGKVAVFFALGGNFVSAAPDTELTARALSRCRLTVHVSTKLNRSHLTTGAQALILPCLGRTERDIQGGVPQVVTVEDSMGVVHRSQGRLQPASAHLLSEPAIVARLAHTTLGDKSSVPWLALAKDYDAIRERISRVVPDFEDFNRRIRSPFGFVLPNAARDRRFVTKSGKAELTLQALPEATVLPGELLMTTVRSHDQFNTTVYGNDDRYRGVYGHRRVVLLNREDIEARGLEEGARVTLSSGPPDAPRRAARFVVVRYDVPRGTCVTYFPEANALVPLDSYAEGSMTPASKSVPVRLERE